MRLTGIGFIRPIDAARAVCRVGEGRVHMLRGIEIRRDFMRRLSLAKAELSEGRKMDPGKGVTTVVKCCTAFVSSMINYHYFYVR